MTRSRFRTRVLLAAAVSALAAALVAAPASAHDALVASDPAAGDRLDTAPAEIVLTYSAAVIEGSASVAVVDTEGGDWVAGDPGVVDPEVTVAHDTRMPDGADEVRWRVASSDGHPIEGLIPFTVGDVAHADEATTDATPPGHDDATPHSHDDETPTPVVATPPADDDGGVLRTVLIGVGGALAAVAVFVVVLLVRRRGAANEI